MSIVQIASLSIRRSPLSLLLSPSPLGGPDTQASKSPINWPRSSRRIALDKLLLLKVTRLFFLVGSYRQYSGKMSGGPKALRTAHRIGLENNR